VAVAAGAPHLQRAAQELARELHLPLTPDPGASRFTYLLVLTTTHLQLQECGPGAAGPVYVNFLSGSLAHRRRFGGGRNQALAKAIGLKRGVNPPRVLDVTAGLGRDAFVLACLGCQVEMVERSPIVAALLRDGLQRALADPEVGAIVTARLNLRVSEGRVFMSELRQRQAQNDYRPDVVYLDPMYPHRTRSALVKKEMRTLRAMVGEDNDAPASLATALACARRRVVVKRPRLAEPLEGPPPKIQICAKTTRFDIYIP
jgi:16S rRNA (guanine1516-N2)-methyltransferase